jgi:hypothetical protein
MIFYKNVLISTFLSVILLLVIIGVTMYYTKNKQIYPPILSKCPDFYNLNEDGLCVNSGVWDKDQITVDCNNIDFSGNDYNVQGIGANSGLCKKKKWANDCKVSWDGITNNYSIC